MDKGDCGGIDGIVEDREAGVWNEQWASGRFIISSWGELRFEIFVVYGWVLLLTQLITKNGAHCVIIRKQMGKYLR